MGLENDESYGIEITVRPSRQVRYLGGFLPRGLTELEALPWVELAKEIQAIRSCELATAQATIPEQPESLI